MHDTLQLKIKTQEAEKLIVEKMSKHQKAKKYKERKGKELFYKKYLSKEFCHNFVVELEYEEIVKSLIDFANEKSLDLELEMLFEECYQEFKDGTIDDKETEIFIWRIANCIEILLNEGEELEDEEDD